MTIQQKFLSPRLRAIVLVPVVVALGLGMKFYSGPASDWINNWGPASVAYVWMFMLIAFAVVPRRSAVVPIALAVFTATCLVEFTQLLESAWLKSLCETWFGKGLLGTTFSWWDIPAYLVGAVSGVFLIFWCAIGKGQGQESDQGL